jgi:hypothetical protein
VLSLRERQQAFAAAIFGTAAVEGGLQVYRNNVFTSLTDALAAVYPVVRRLVGESFFNQLARRYIRRYPSRTGNLHDFGEELPAFIATLADTRALAYLPDVASLEWAYDRVFHASDAEPLDVRRLAERGAVEAMSFRLHPAVRLVASRYPVLAIWETNQQDDVATVDLAAGGDWLLVQRCSLERRIERLTPGEFALLHSLAEGAALAEACAVAGAAEPDIDLAAAMGRFVTQSIFTEETC